MTTEKYKYKAVDIYDVEGREVIGYADNLNTVKKLARERITDTDGECLIEVRILNPETQKYKFFKILETC